MVVLVLHSVFSSRLWLHNGSTIVRLCSDASNRGALSWSILFSYRTRGVVLVFLRFHLHRSRLSDFLVFQIYSPVPDSLLHPHVMTMTTVNLTHFKERYIGNGLELLVMQSL